MFDEHGQFHMPMPVFIQPDGPCTLWYPDGSKWIAATYQHGVLDGPLTVFFKDGSPQLKAIYAAGFPVGRYEVFHENGTKKNQRRLFPVSG